MDLFQIENNNDFSSESDEGSDELERIKWPYQEEEIIALYSMDTKEGTEEQEIVKALIPREIISTGRIDIRQTPFVNHQIPLKPNTRPITYPLYRLNQERKDFLKKELDKMLEKGII